MKNLIFIIFVLFSSLVCAEELGINKDFSVILPNGWVEIPQEILRNYEVSLSKASKEGKLQKYDYGYQLSSATNWLEHPYILIQVKRDGRVPEGQLKKYKKLKTEGNKGLAKAQKEYSGFFSNAKQGEMIYDENNHVLWSTISMTVAEIGKVKALIAIKLTDFGFVQIMGYAKEENFPQYELIYKSMVNTLLIQDGKQYKPRITDNIPIISGIDFEQVAISGIIGGAIGGIFGLVGFIKKRLAKNKS